MRNLRSSLLLIISIIMPVVSMAHEGHGHEHPWSPGHFLANPVHSIPMAVAVVLITFLVVRRYFLAKRERSK